MMDLKSTLGNYVTSMINNYNGLWRKKIITNSTAGPPAHVDHVVRVEEAELLLARAQTLDSANAKNVYNYNQPSHYHVHHQDHHHRPGLRPLIL